MKKILCLTDLSENSKAGIQYANELARKQGATLLFMHTYKTVYDKKDGIHPALFQYTDTEARNLLNNLCIQFKRFERYSAVNYEYIVKEGTVIENLNPVINTYGIDLVVLALEGQLDKTHEHYSSVLKFIVQEASCPVLVVPTTCAYSDIQELVYATELEEGSTLNPGIVQFADDFKAHLRLVMFVQDNGDKNSDILFGRFNKLKESARYNRLAFELKKSDNITDSINQFCESHNAQIVVMENQLRSEFQKVNNPSFTNTFLYHAKLPVLICHKIREHVYQTK